MGFEINRRGQMVIWVIIAMFLVVAIILFFYVESRVNKPTEEVVEELNPEQFIDICVRKHVRDAVDMILPQGGFVEPKIYREYSGDKIEYLCFNGGNYFPCVNQHPLYLRELETELKEYVEPKVEECFEDLEFALEKRNSELIMTGMDFNLEIIPDKVRVSINRDITITKGGDGLRFKEFDSETLSALYDLARIAMEIANQEAKYCYFENYGYMLLYPDYKIEKISLSDDTRIYEILDDFSGDELKIAVRSCAIPPGL